MALETVTINAGTASEAQIAVDTIAGVSIPVSKIVVGADGSVGDVVSSGNPLPVAASAWPLPTGAATSENQGTGNAVLADILTALGQTLAVSANALPLPTGAATEATLNAIGALLAGGIVVDGSGVTQPISAQALPLPTGAATSENQGTGNASLAAIQAAAEIVDDWDEANRAAVNLIVGQAGIAAGTGVDGATVPRVSLATNVALPAGTNTLGQVGLAALTSGGASAFKSIDLDETEEEVKGAAGQVYAIHCINLADAVRYLKLYDATAANVVVGTTVPNWTFPIPTAGDTNGAGFTLTLPVPLQCSNGITVAATTGLADNDATAPGANEVVLNLLYK